MKRGLITRRGGLSHGAAVAIIITAALALFLIYLGTGDPVDMMELFNLVPVKEAMRDGHWLMPTLNGLPRLEKPPLPVWLPAGLGALFHTDSLWILRLPSALVGVLAALGTYGIGCVMFGRRGRLFALAAGLFVPAMFVFNREARLASYDIFATGFLTCGAMLLIWMAEALGEIQNSKLKTQNDPASVRRRCSGGATFWFCSVFAGVATGLSVLSKGPVPAATVMIPLGFWLLVYHRRGRVWAGVLVAALVSMLTFFPWLVAIGGLSVGGHWMIQPRIERAWHVWAAEFLQFGTGDAANIGAGTKAQLTDPIYYYLQFLYWSAPLTPLLIAGLVMPLLPRKKGVDIHPRDLRARWLFWLVVVGGLVMLSIPSEKKARYALQLFPFAALLCAAVWQEFGRLGKDHDADFGGKLVLASQALFFIVPGVAGLIIAAWVGITRAFPRWPIVADFVHVPGVPLTLAFFLLITAAGFWLWRQMARRHWSTATWGTATVGCLLTFVMMWAYRGLPAMHSNPVREPVRAAFAAARQQHAGIIATTKAGRLWLATDYFADQVIPAFGPAEATAWVKDHPGETLWLTIVDREWDPDKHKTVVSKPVEQQLEAIEEALGKKRQPPVGEWSDEGRHTILFQLK